MNNSKTSKAASTLGTVARIGYKTTKSLLSFAFGTEKGAAGLAMATSSTVILVLVVICILLSMCVMAVPSGTLAFSTDESYDSFHSRTYNAIRRGYQPSSFTNGADIQGLVQQYGAGVAPGYCDVGTYTYYSGSSWHMSSNSCELKFEITPGLDAMADNIGAYASAVNGLLSDYRMDEEEAEDFDYSGELEASPSEGVLDGDDVKEEVRDSLVSRDDLDVYQDIDSYGEELALEATQFFVLDDDTLRWTKGPVSYQRYLNESSGQFMTKAIGTVYIPLYYDLSFYKMDDLEQVASMMSDEAGDEFLGRQNLTELMDGYYDAYFMASGKVENRYEIFRPLLGDGTMFYVPISGLSSGLLLSATEGVSGWSGSISDIFDFDSGVYGPGTRQYYAIWNFIHGMHEDGYIKGAAKYNCTMFADAWFYLLYGYDGLTGDGGQMADYLVGHYDDRFEYGKGPAPGGIVSIHNGGSGGHVLCVDAVDYDAGTITWSEGNIHGNGTVRIATTATFDEFFAFEGRNANYVFANPKQ